MLWSSSKDSPRELVQNVEHGSAILLTLPGVVDRMSSLLRYR